MFNNTDEYSRFMADVFDERTFLAVATGFLSFFGDPENGSQTVISENHAILEIDIVRADGEPLAATIHRGAGSEISPRKTNTGEKFSNVGRLYPLIEEEAPINSTQLLLRQAGESSYSGRSRIDRNRAIAIKNHFDMMRKQIRTHEFFARESILTGKHPSIIGTSNPLFIYDFLRNPAHIITVGTVWTDTGAPIMSDIDGACEKIEANGHMSPNFFGIGSSAMDGFLKNTDILAKADNRRFELIEISTNNPVPPEFAKFLRNGWIARGRLRTPAGRVLWIFNYNKRYTDKDGNSFKYMPEGKAFICDTNARCDRYFGPPDRLPVTPDEMAWYQSRFGFSMSTPPMLPVFDMGGVIRPDIFYHDAFDGAKKKDTIMRTQSAPVYPTTQTDAFVTLEGLA